MAIDMGSVTYSGRQIRLTESAYANNYGTDRGVRYYARGLGDDGEEYLVEWETTEAWNAMQDAHRSGQEPAIDASDPGDESLACDWDSPVAIRNIEA